MSMYQKIIENKKKSDEGNLVYFPFPKQLGEFTEVYPGRLPGHLTAITGNTGSAKSSLSRYIIFETIDYFLAKGIDYRVIWFALEESKEEFEYALLSWVLRKYSNGKIRYNVEHFLNLGKEVNSKDYKHIKLLEEIYQKIRGKLKVIDNVYNSYGIYKKVLENAEKYGTFEKKEGSESWTSYTPDENIYFEVVIDHIGLLKPEEKQKDLREAMQDCVSYMRKYVTKSFKYSVIVVQQQAAESENLEHIKEHQVYASLQGLGDNKALARDYMNVIGITSPHRYGLKMAKTSLGDINCQSLKDYCRVISILKRRFGKSDKRYLVFFDGCCNHFEKIDDINKKTLLVNQYDS